MLFGLLLEHFHVATKNFAGMLIAKMKPIAFAVFVRFAGCAFSCFGPGTITHILVTVIPNAPKIIGIDISLNVICTQTRASADGTIYQYGTNVNACLAVKWIITDFQFVIAQKSFATIRCFYFSINARLFYELH